MTLKAVREKLQRSWCKETCYEPQKESWIPTNPTMGQCFVTALVLHDIFGGKIIKAKSSQNISHYWNLIGAQEVDMTRSQFASDEVFTQKQIILRENLEGNDRYYLLKERFNE